MFEVGFSELLLIFVIALVVLGPEKLPKLVSKVGRMAGKARSMARQFREQLESEVNLEELNRSVKTPSAQSQPPPEPDSTETVTPHHPAAGPAVAAASVAAATAADASLAPVAPARDYAGTYPYEPAPQPRAPYETAEYAAAHAAAAAPATPDAVPVAAAGEADTTPAHAQVPLPPTETHERGI